MSAQSDDAVVLPDRHSEEYYALRRTIDSAVERGDVQTLRALGARVIRHAEVPGYPMPNLAIKHRQPHVLEWAVEESERTGIDIVRGWKTMHLAAYWGDVDKLKAASDEDLGLKAGWGATVLHAAAMGDQVDAIEYLVHERGLDVCAVDHGYHTVLAIASAFGRVAAIEVLVACGARLHRRPGYPSGALMVAAKHGQLAAMEKLVQLGVDVELVGAFGGVVHAAAESGSVDAIDAAVRLGADPCAVSRGGTTALHAAACEDQPGGMRRLVQLGVPLHDVDSRGHTALHCTFRSPQACRALLELGADRWIEDDEGRTAWDMAVRCKHDYHSAQQVVELLDTHWPIVPCMAQLLLGLKGPSESSLTRFAAHSAFEPKVLSLVNCLLTGKEDNAFEQLMGEC